MAVLHCCIPSFLIGSLHNYIIKSAMPTHGIKQTVPLYISIGKKTTHVAVHYHHTFYTCTIYISTNYLNKLLIKFPTCKVSQVPNQ